MWAGEELPPLQKPFHTKDQEVYYTLANHKMWRYSELARLVFHQARSGSAEQLFPPLEDL
jgi:hypothetical protein